MPEDKTNWTLVDLVRRQARRYGDREFISFEHGTSLTYAGFDEESTRLARILAGLGVGPGDRVLALLKNRIEFLWLMLATVKLGAIFVPLNTELKGAFLQHQVQNSEPRVVFVDAVLANAFAQVEAAAAAPEAVVSVAGAVPDVLPGALRHGTAMSFEAFAQLPATGAGVLVEPKPADIALIMYTSGTTGPAKGVLMPHGHCYLLGLGMQLLGSLIAGAHVHIVERFSPNRWLDEVRSAGATLTNALGVMPEFIFRTPKRPDDADNPLRKIMAVPIAAEWGEAFEKRFGLEIVQGFGMTECNIPAYGTADDPLAPGCAGRILDDFFEVGIVDPESDEPMPQGEVGEIVVRPKEASCFMAGYYRMPEKTVEAWRNLWFHSGDAGRFDEEGRLYYVDRIKDCIRRRAENISSFEIEQVLNNHPDIAESAVVGIMVADAGGEEEVKALILPAPEAEIDNVALLDYCVERMPRYAVPRFIEQLAELPKTPTGKIQKQELRAAGVTAQTWDRESVGYTIVRR
ncbi:MAG: AMP-binding protein [Alphaproteobacteria bacterium]|jgi:crotonobetaine/carnitine-CoA ligase|nr:AMP-binding protein [Alphaproteobacteria bacterium]